MLSDPKLWLVPWTPMTEYNATSYTLEIRVPTQTTQTTTSGQAEGNAEPSPPR